MPDPHEPQPGRTASRVGTWIRGKYFLEAELGAGGMAVVYAARHRNKKRFAIKILHAELARNTDVQTRFLREGYVANSVEHPGAVAVIDEDTTEDGAAFLVMELLDGGTVEHVARGRGGQLGLGPVLAIAHQTLEVLAAAHARNVVHRDIKPGNLFVTRDGQVKVLDFGIARLHEAATPRATQNGTSLGTPAYMAPEQALGKTGLVDGRSDVWSVGATMFTLLTGRDVHEGETPQHMMVLAATARAPSVSTLSRFMPAAAAALIDRALAFDQAERWPSAQAMDEAICSLYVALFGEAITRAPLVDLVASTISPTTIREFSEPTMMSPGVPPAASGETTVTSSPVRFDARPPGGDSSPAQREADPSVFAAPATVGPTTEQPVSDGKGDTAREPPRGRWPAVLGAALALVLGLVLVAAFRHSSPSSAGPAAEPSAGGTLIVPAAAPFAPPSTDDGPSPAEPLTGSPEPAPTPDAGVGGVKRPSPRSGKPPPKAEGPRPNASSSAPTRPAPAGATDFDRQ